MSIRYLGFHEKYQKEQVQNAQQKQSMLRNTEETELSDIRVHMSKTGPKVISGDFLMLQQFCTKKHNSFHIASTYAKTLSMSG